MKCISGLYLYDLGKESKVCKVLKLNNVEMVLNICVVFVKYINLIKYN